MQPVQTSSLAHIDPRARLGEGVTIEPFAVIKGDVEIGDGTWIGSHAILENGARVGKSCQIFPGAVISGMPQDLKYQGEYTTAELGDGVIVREYATINRGTNDQQRTVIEEGVLIMAYAHVAHDCRVSHHAIIANTVNVAGHVEIEAHAIVGGSCAIHQFCRVGQHSMTAGGTIIRKDVPPYVLAARDPMSYVGVNSRGLRRRGFESEAIQEIQDIYRQFFLSGLPYRTAFEKVRAEFPPSENRDIILDFFQASNRGFLRGYAANGKHA